MKIQSLIPLLLIAGIFSSQAEAAPQTTLEFPLIVVDEYSDFNLKSLNKELKEKGLSGLPEIIKLTQKGQRAYFRVLMKRIAAAREAGILSEDDQFVIESGYLYEYPQICFRGDIDDVAGIIDAMHTVPEDESYRAFIEPDSGILGVSWGAKRALFSDYLKNEDAVKDYYGVEDGGEIPEVVLELLEWFKKDQVFVVTDLGPQGDGTEAYDTVIKACR